jgi:hypothetical protein
MTRTSIEPFAAVESTSLTAESSEYLRLMIRSDTPTSAKPVPLVRSISNQNSLLLLEDDKYSVPDVTRL